VWCWTRGFTNCFDKYTDICIDYLFFPKDFKGLVSTYQAKQEDSDIMTDTNSDHESNEETSGAKNQDNEENLSKIDVNEEVSDRKDT